MQEPPNTDWNLELARLGRKAFKIVLSCQHCQVAKNSPLDTDQEDVLVGSIQME
jgi:hypothetical protein